jgi:RimJ/RimL family protein N-acetyltransferase
MTSRAAVWHAAPVTDAPLTFTPIRTERLVIRPWREEEAPRLFDILRRDEVVRWLGHPRTLENVEEAREKITTMADDLPKSEWAMEVVETGEVAGSVMLVDVPNSEGPDGTKLVQVGWYAHPDATGHGYITEAARAVLEYGLASGLAEIHALTHTDNYPSMAVCDRLGMTYLGVTEEWYDDAPSSHYIVRAGEWPPDPDSSAVQRVLPA